MKTNAILKTSVLILLFFFLNNAFKAQTPACNYQVTNALSCPVNVTVEFYNGGGSPCKSITSTIPGSTTTFFNCTPGCSGTLSNVQVIFNWAINPTNTPFGGVAVDISNNSSSGTLSQQPCSNGADFYMQWSSSKTVIGQ